LRAHTNYQFVEPVPIGKHVNIGGAVALLGKGILGAEAVGVFAPGFRGVDPSTPSPIQTSRVFTIMGNAVLTTPRRLTEDSLRPFVSGGIGWMRLSVAGPDVVSLREDFTAFDIGGGAIGFFTQHTGVRFDLRYFKRLGHTTPGLTVIKQPELSFMSASVGVVFRR